LVYRPTARVLTVLELLQARGRMTGAELARRLEVDIRTVRNYIETLIDLGIPVEAERGRYGAYRLRPGYKLPPLIFTEDEALALTLSLIVARQAGIEQASPALEGVFAKVERVLPQATRARIQAVERTLTYEKSDQHPAPSAPAVLMLSSAIQSGRRVRLHYRSAREAVTERPFDPYGIANHRGFWYVIGYCHLRAGQRLFRLDRILHVEMLDETFLRPASFDALEVVQHALATVPRVWHIEIWLQTTLEEVQRLTRFPKAQFEEAHQGVIVRGDVEDLPWATRLLAGLGMPFIILSPPELRTVMRDYLLTMARYAESTESELLDPVRSFQSV
jgi:predicted DNA-binding transcriptional regulator YafY